VLPKVLCCWTDRVTASSSSHVRNAERDRRSDNRRRTGYSFSNAQCRTHRPRLSHAVLRFSRFTVQVQIRLDSGRSGVCYADPEYRAEPNRWYHVAATYNGWVARLYVDGFTIGAYLDDNQNISGRVCNLRSQTSCGSRDALTSSSIPDNADCPDHNGGRSGIGN
jgi:hypothetical protein